MSKSGEPGAYAAAGVDIDAQEKGSARGQEARPVDLHAGRAVRHRLVRRPVPPRSRRPRGAGAGGVGRRRRHQAQGGAGWRATTDRRPRPRQPLRQRHPGAGRAAALLPRLHRRRASSSREMVAASSRAWPTAAARTAARCSAARPPRCRASTSPATSTSSASSSASSTRERVIDGTRDRGRATCSSACPRPACTPTATRWRARSSSRR